MKMNNIELLIDMWGSLYDQKITVSEIIEQFFHLHKVQCLNDQHQNLNQQSQAYDELLPFVP